MNIIDVTMRFAHHHILHNRNWLQLLCSHFISSLCSSISMHFGSVMIPPNVLICAMYALGITVYEWLHIHCISTDFTDQYLNFNSNHQDSCKESVISLLINRNKQHLTYILLLHLTYLKVTASNVPSIQKKHFERSYLIRKINCPWNRKVKGFTKSRVTTVTLYILVKLNGNCNSKFKNIASGTKGWYIKERDC